MVSTNTSHLNKRCSSTTRIPLPLYASAYTLLFAVGFPLLNVHQAALLASLIGNRKQVLDLNYILLDSIPLGIIKLEHIKGVLGEE